MKIPKIQTKNLMMLRPIIFIVSVAAVGAALLFYSKAETPFISHEPEQGSISGAACNIPDAAASGGSAIQFGGGCPLEALFKGESQLVEDTRFSVDRPDLFRDANGTAGHSETATVFFGGEYKMYYRTFVRPDGSKQANGVPSGIALATSSDGHRWTVHNGGRPLITNRASRLQAGTACQPSPCELAVYAPSVIVDSDGTLKMAYEVMDTGVVTPAGMPRHWIEAAGSSDGINWQTLTDAGGGPAKVLAAQTAWEGFDASTNQHKGNVGTPTLAKEDGVYQLYYHGYHCCSAQFNRGMATGNSLAGLARSPSNPTLKQSGGWQAYGPGKGDVIKEGSYYYYVFESFKGGETCGRPDVVIGWGIARSTDKINWQYAAANPIRTDRIKWSCGEDMPSWQVVNGEAPMVIATNIDYPPASEPSVRRYKIVPGKTAISSSEVAGMGMSNSDAGYWQVAKNGGVFAFGNAAFHGSAIDAGRTDIVGMAVRPNGDGYLVAAANGTVYAFGAATHRGDMAGKPLNSPIVGIEGDPDGDGYWLVAADGGVFAYAAAFHGSAGAIQLNQPIVGMLSTSSGGGYWLVAKDGGIFAYGNALHKGSLPGLGISRNNIIGMSVRPDDQGYWIVAADGAVYSFNAPFLGGADGYTPFTNMLIAAVGRRSNGTGAGGGYYLVARDGAVIDFGSAVYYGHARGPGWNN